MRLNFMGTMAFATVLSLSQAFAGELVINSDQSDPAPKKAMEAVIADFEKANPDVKVKWNNFDHEGYKAAINNFLKANPPDIAAWYAGNRMAPQVKAGLFEDVTDLWQQNGLDATLKSAAPSMTIDGKKWGVPYTDPRVKAVFDKWGELVKPGYFVANHAALDWQDAIPLFVQGKAAMYLMGNFAVAPMIAGGLKEEQIGYLPFPEITAGVPRAEDAPTDTFHIPSGAKNKADARKFLAFIASPEQQAKMNATLGQLPVNNKAPKPEDKFLSAGFETLSTAAGLAQFFDRDAPAEMAKAGMEGFQKFMVRPEQQDAILADLEKVRARVYK